MKDHLSILLFLLSHHLLYLSTALDPVFLTTLDDFQTGSKVVSTSNPVSNDGFSYETTNLTFSNLYTSTPSIGLGLKFINSDYTHTTGFYTYAFDLTITETSTSYVMIQLNRTDSTITQMSINYIATTNFFDIRHTYIDLQSETVYTSASSISRTSVLQIQYQTKSNSTNAIVTYSAIGLFMVRNSTNWYNYQITTSSLQSSTFNISLLVDGYNRMKWIRLCSISYQAVATVISEPYYLDMGFKTSLSATIDDSSGITLSELGIIFTGMTDWAINDVNSIIDYNIVFSSKDFTIETTSLGRSRTNFLWYRKQSCQEYYYLNGHTCDSCHYSCLTCVNPDNTSCLTCPTTRIFNSLENTCECITGYTDVGSSICVETTCSDTCKTCANLDQCGTCFSSFNRVLVGTECVCEDYTFDSFDTDGIAFCFPCHYSCVSCSQKDVETACLTCNLDKDHRVRRDSNNTCECIDGYYDNSQTVCQACHYSCASCSSSDSCLTCNATLGRLANNSDYCLCEDGTYDNLLEQQCQPCPYNCLTCNSTSCLSCSTTRSLIDDDCSCLSGYFDDGASLQCEQCNYTCASCDDLSQCTSCSSLLFRYMDNGECLCPQRFYDDFPNEECLICHFTCLHCSDSLQDSCSACDSDKYRQLSLDNRCICMDGYYQLNSNTEKCEPCHYTCETCSNATECLTCSAINFRTIQDNNCLCIDGYYDQGNHRCQLCYYRCLTCSSLTTCDTCDNTTRDTSNLATCLCLDGFYDDLISSSCLPCPTQCLTCQNGNNCTSCSSNKILSSTKDCVCASGTYEPYCDPCSFQCSQCVGGANTDCVKCNGNAYRSLNSSKGTCDCYDGYFSDGNNQLCISCHYSCQTCVNSASCESCPTNRVSNGTLCECLPQFYEHRFNLKCIACHYSCQLCSEYSICTQCDSSKFRQASLSTTLCECSDGYYDNLLAELCYSCQTTCMTCRSYDECTSCNSSEYRYFLNNSCPCLDGYYQQHSLFTCQPCHYSCEKCDDSSTCTSCGSDRSLNSNKLCQCLAGTFENPLTDTCELCSYPCSQCTNSTSTCEACEGSHILSAKDCICPDGTFQNSTHCQSCLQECQTCSDQNSCQSCKFGSSRNLINNSCPCIDGYHSENDTLVVCQKCHYSCQTCSDSASCLTCPTGRVHIPGSYCQCPSLQYFDDGINAPCLPCSYQCLTCEVIKTNCTSCSSANHRKIMNGSSCVCEEGYYDDGLELCKPCHYSCLTCNSDSSCTTCNSSLERVYVTGPYCSCQIGTFDLTDYQECETCHYSCSSCESTSTNCLQCPGTRIYDNSTKTCPCENMTYDDGSAACLQCLYYCKECTNGAECTQCPSTRYLQLNNQCVCLSGYYDDGSSSECQKCSQLCLQCTEIDKCTNCEPSYLRVLSGYSCVCEEGYFDNYNNNGNISCEVCHYTCENCRQVNQCTSCSETANRIYDVVTKLCSCKTGFYDDQTNQECSPCPFDCRSCSDANTCLSCLTERQLDNVTNRCLCKASYYQNGTKCESCPPECATCSDYSTCQSCNGNRTLENGSCVCDEKEYPISNSQLCSSCDYRCDSCKTSYRCLTCNITFQRYLSGDYCKCLTGYFDDGVNQQCQPCHYSCLTCDDSSSCLTCANHYNRVWNSSSELCECESGYYEDNVTLSCIKCGYSCVTCVNGYQCESCNSLYKRKLENGNCVCQSEGYFDSGSSICSACHHTCLTCEVSSTYCTSCENSTKRSLQISSCQCIDGYYEYNQQTTCLACSYKCLTCEVSSTQCTLCENSHHRFSTPDCQCEVGMFDNGSSSCQLCDYRCQTCSNSISCDTCNSTKLRFMNNDTQLCDCQTNYYDDGDQECLPCYYTCQTCNHPTKCLTCPSSRSYDTGQCICPIKFYDDTSSNECQPCDYTCESCKNGSQCSACSSAAYRQFNLSSGYCSCLQGYYDSLLNEQQCLKCEDSCLTCVNGTHCESCPINQNKTINISEGSNYCICIYAHYETASGICQPCHYSCQKCETESYFCTECHNTSYRTLTQNQCLCPVYYYDNGVDSTCLMCFNHCLECFGSQQDQCSLCDNETFMLSHTCFSVCPDYYFESDYGTCELCSSFCLNCLNQTLCQECQSGFFLYANQNGGIQCLDECPEYYYDNTTHCLNCQSPCLHCTDLYVCVDCIESYYESTQCYPCHSSCKNCGGGTAKDCLSCVDGYYRNPSSNICEKLNCLATEYVHSTYGCFSCSDSYANSEQCNSNGASSCVSGYMMVNNSCLKCDKVTGYEEVNGECAEICGDGIIIEDICDDGNNLNGDGCSSVCSVEESWECSNETCSLVSNPSLSVLSQKKVQGKNRIEVEIEVSIGLRLQKQNFNLQFQNKQQHQFSVTALNSKYTRYKLTINYKQSIASNKLNIFVISPANSQRLLQSASPLAIQLSLQIEITIETLPPALYYDQSLRNIFQVPLFITLAVLHAVTILIFIIPLLLKFKIMLIVIECYNFITLLYIYGGLGLHNISELSSPICRALQPFIYPFGDNLSAESSFHDFSFTQLILCVVIIQLLTLLIFFFVSLCFPLQHSYKYYYFGFLYTFMFEFILVCIFTLVHVPINSLQSSYSWGLTFIIFIVGLMENGLYMMYSRTYMQNKTQIKPVPTVSYNTIDVKKQDDKIDPFAEEHPSSSQKNQNYMEEQSDHKTQALANQNIKNKLPIQQKLQLFNLYDLNPKEQSLKWYYLPLKFFFAILLAIFIQFQSASVRLALLMVGQVLALICVCISKKIKSLESLKLIVFILILFFISLLGLIISVSIDNKDIKSTENVFYFQIIILVLIFLGSTLNIIFFIVEVCKSADYKEYLIEKKNQTILEKNARKNRLKGIPNKVTIKNIYSKQPQDSDHEYPLELTQTKINKDSSLRKIDSDFYHLPMKKNTYNTEKLAVFDDDENEYERQEVGKKGIGRTSRTQKQLQAFNIKKKYSGQNYMEKQKEKEGEISLTQIYENNHLKSTRAQERKRPAINPSSRFNNHFQNLQTELKGENSETIILIEQKKEDSYDNADNTLISEKSDEKKSIIKKKRISQIINEEDEKHENSFDQQQNVKIEDFNEEDEANEQNNEKTKKVFYEYDRKKEKSRKKQKVKKVKKERKSVEKKQKNLTKQELEEKYAVRDEKEHQKQETKKEIQLEEYEEDIEGELPIGIKELERQSLSSEEGEDENANKKIGQNKVKGKNQRKKNRRVKNMEITKILSSEKNEERDEKQKREKMMRRERIDSISSIGEEKEEKVEMESEGEGMTVFKKILQDYQKYNDKKIRKNFLKKKK